MSTLLKETISDSFNKGLYHDNVSNLQHAWETGNLEAIKLHVRQMERTLEAIKSVVKDQMWDNLHHVD